MFSKFESVMKRIVLVHVLIIGFGFSHAQSVVDIISRPGRWSVVGYTGVARLDSDIHPDYDLSWILKSPTIDASVEYNVHPTFSVGFNFGGFIFNQGDADEEFKTGGVHSSGFISFDLLNLVSGRKNKHWSLWGNAGIGAAGLVWPEYTTTRNFQGPDPVQNGVVFPTTFLIFPFSVNLEYNLSKNISLGMHMKYIYTNTDHLESIHRGRYNDQWESLGITLRYKFTPKEVKSVRDELTGATTMASQDIINQLQQQIDQLAQRIDTVENNLGSLDYRVIKLEGILSNDGPDTDQDGVPDIRDLEPNTPPGTPVDFWGRSMKVQTIKAEDILAVYFDFDSIELDKIAQITLIKVADKMADNPDLMLEIRGYTDYLGANAYNKKLSQLRAERVKQELVQKYGIPHNRMVANGMGKVPEPPVKSLANRRCDFFFSK